MSEKPRQNHLGKAYIRIESKYVEKKKDKPWKKERGTFDNVNIGDIMEGMTNRTNTEKFSRHKYRQYVE